MAELCALLLHFLFIVFRDLVMKTMNKKRSNKRATAVRACVCCGRPTRERVGSRPVCGGCSQYDSVIAWLGRQVAA